MSQTAILVSEPRQVEQTLALARSIESADHPLLIVIGSDTWETIQNAAPAGVRLERINLHPEESGEAEKLASLAARELFTKLNFSIVQKSLVHILGNEMYLNFFIPLFKVLVSLKAVIHHKDITELLLIGGNKQAHYYPVFFAEGERPFPFLYFRSWFINQFIYNTFKEMIEVIWFETPSFIVTGVRLLRRWLIFNARLYGVFRGYLWHRLRFGCQRRLRFPSNRHAVLLPIIIRTKAQFEIVRNLYSFLEKKSDFMPIILVGHSNLSQHFMLASQETTRYISAPSCLSFIQFCKILFKITRNWLSFLQTKEIIHFSFWSTSLNLELRSVVSELKVLIPDLFYRQGSILAALETIKEQIDMNVGPVLTTELIAHGCALHKQALKEAQIKMPLIVLQGVAMKKLPYPFWWGDVYLLSSREVYTFALEHCKGAQDRFLYIGEFKWCDDIFLINDRRMLKEIVVFTQPDEYEFLFKSLIGKLCTYIKQTPQSVSLIIKLHPRDRNRRWYRRLSRKYPFVQVLSDADITELCQRATVVITATSSVLYDAYHARAPIIAFLEGYQGEVPEYVRRFATHVIFNGEDLLRILTNHARMIAEAEAKYQRERKALEQEHRDGCQEISDYLLHLIAQDKRAKA